jgi:predicted metallopeptidase
MPLKTHDQINNTVNQLTTAIQNSISLFSSVTPNPSNQNKQSNTHPIFIIELIKAKCKTRATWENLRYPIDKIVFNQLTNTVKTELSKHGSTQFESHLESLTPSNGSIWRTTKALINQRDTIHPLVCPNNKLASSDIEKANFFGNQLSETFTHHPSTLSNIDHENSVHCFLYAPLPTSLPAKPITPSEILITINELHTKKSPGHDLITNKIAKHLTKKSILLLTHIFNAILRLSHFPPTWKYSIIFMIFKSNKPKQLVTFYRPIALLSTLGKLFEKLLLKRITAIIHENNILPVTQFGFRTKHNTIYQIHRITEHISTFFEKKQFCP